VRAALRYLAGYWLDFLRERVTADDFGPEQVRRVLVTPGLDPAGQRAVRRMFPASAVHTFTSRTALGRIRRLRLDVACIGMAGGGLRERMLALLSGARHKLLIPSPDYVYRLGMRRGWTALAWAIIDRLLVSPLALLWLGLTTCWLYATGLVRRAAEAGDSGNLSGKVLALRLVPPSVYLALLRRLRGPSEGAQLYSVIGSAEGEREVAEIADRVVCTAGLGAREALQRVRRLRPDLVILVGGADYGLSPTYLKAAALARLSGARRRRQWETGDEPPGRPLGQAVCQALRRRGAGLWGRCCRPLADLVARPWLRRAYRRPPRRGPALVQVGITEACNYQCLMCLYHNPQASRDRRDSDLPRMSAAAFARLLGELRRMGTQEIDLCGNGEPLTHPEAMDLIALARDMGFQVRLATNASLLSEERARRLVDLGLLRLHASINAGTEDTYARMHPGTPPGSFSRIIARLREMADYADETARRPVQVEFSAVLTRLNMGEIAQMVEAARQARAGWVMLIPMMPVKGQEELLPRPQDWPAVREEMARAEALAGKLGLSTNLSSLEPTANASGTRSIYEQVPCYVGHEFALIIGGGKVIFCCHCSRPLGDVNEEGFGQIWKSETYREARRIAMAIPLTKEPLWECGCFHACSHALQNLRIHRRLHGSRALRSVP